VTYAGGGGFLGSTTTVTFQVTRQATRLSHLGPALVFNGRAARLSGQLSDRDGRPIIGRAVALSLGSPLCSAITGGLGLTAMVMGAVRPELASAG
jgi:hypothetical protein